MTSLRWSRDGRERGKGVNIRRLLLIKRFSFQLWRLVNLVPTELSRQFAEQRKTQQEYLKVRRELNATSSQDEFAKWAKLRRQHDKLLEQLEKKSMSYLPVMPISHGGASIYASFG